jgi:hypothetical protein
MSFPIYPDPHILTVGGFLAIARLDGIRMANLGSAANRVEEAHRLSIWDGGLRDRYTETKEKRNRRENW